MPFKPWIDYGMAETGEGGIEAVLKGDPTMRLITTETIAFKESRRPSGRCRLGVSECQRAVAGNRAGKSAK